MKKTVWTLLAFGCLMLVAAACRSEKSGTAGLSGTVSIDGSSTVFPISEAVAEEFRSHSPNVQVPVGLSGTGGGFQKFLRGEIDIAAASRPIKESELKLAREKSIEFVELAVAFDGLSVVVNPKNSWCSTMTVEELKRVWEPGAQNKVTRWRQIRPDWPDKEIHLFGAGTDSGTYDYFTSAVVGKEGASRGDFTASEDDNVLVQGVAADEFALGFFGYAYYEENKTRVKLVAIDDGNPVNGDGPILPSPETIAGATYQPLSRPLFIYVAKKAAERPEVLQFVEFYLQEAPKLVREVGYVPLPDATYALVRERFQARTSGSIFEQGGSQVNVSLTDLMKASGPAK